MVALICSRVKMCWNVRVTEDVPAPDEPVTAMTGCLADMVLLPLQCPFTVPIYSAYLQGPEQGPGVEQRVVEGRRRSGGPVPVVALDPLDLVPGAQDQRRALVQAGGRQVHDALAPGARAAAGLLDDERDRIALVHQPEPPRLGRLLAVPGVQEHAAAGEDAVRLGDQRGDPAHVEVSLARPGPWVGCLPRPT